MHQPSRFSSAPGLEPISSLGQVFWLKSKGRFEQVREMGVSPIISWLRSKSRFILAGLVISSLFLLSNFYSTSTVPSSSSSSSSSRLTMGLVSTHPTEKLVKPQDTIISGLIFYGRRDRVAAQHCYIDRNLVDNGGWLDEVLWIVNTHDKADIEYLDRVIAENPKRHKKIAIEGDKLWVYTYWKAWAMLERNKYYVKVDDDIIWMADDAIPRLVTSKLNNPDALVVSANIINNPPLGFLHYHAGALHPYLPETEKPATKSDSWRPSEHPFFTGPKDVQWHNKENAPFKPPYKGHRWLRVKDDKSIRHTPVSELKYEVWGNSYESWGIATQMLYSLLENIETQNLDVYRFNRPWDMDGERIRINFMTFWSNDILDTDVEHWPDNRGDEDMIVLDLPPKLKRPVLIAGDALGAHLSYAAQGGVLDTDLLSRYQSLAKETVCRTDIPF